jgi:hypothetical protein
MARSGGWIGTAAEIAAGESRSHPSDKYEQEYEVTDQWTSLFVSMLSTAHGATALLRKQRGTTQRLAVQSKDLATLATIESEFRRLYAPLGQALARALVTFCQSHLPNAAPAKP